MSEKITFSSTAFNEYQHWQSQDRKTLKRINLLLNDILRNPHEAGIGKAERLGGNLTGCCSRRIDETNRLIYKVSDNGNIEIIHCRGHYGEK
jgi:toxin YoeB